jgi:putative endonuclease
MSAAKQIQGSVSYYAGQAAENAVAQDYVRRGYTLACERWRGKRGEIDLIMRSDADLIFVEVKKSESFERAALRVSRRQIDRIMGSAEEFLAGEPNGALTNVRFDVALVDQTGQLRIVENAFGHD